MKIDKTKFLRDDWKTYKPKYKPYCKREPLQVGDRIMKLINLK